VDICNNIKSYKSMFDDIFLDIMFSEWNISIELNNDDCMLDVLIDDQIIGYIELNICACQFELLNKYQDFINYFDITHNTIYDIRYSLFNFINKCLARIKLEEDVVNVMFQEKRRNKWE